MSFLKFLNASAIPLLLWISLFGPFVYAQVSISTASLPEGMEMVPYDVQLEATGGVEPYVWSTPGTAIGWGSDAYGEITAPVDLSDVVSISAGSRHTLALKSDGTVVAWGANEYGQSTVPSDLVDVIFISAGNFHNLALKSDGTVVAWGWNYYGQISVPPDLVDVVSISAGGWHNLVLKSDGTVVAWGANNHEESTVPMGLSNVVTLSAGHGHSLALKADGTVVGWGNDDWLNTVPDDLNNVVSISAGLDYSLALKSDGTIAAWGRNFEGQCDVPEDLTEVVSISAGELHSLALKSDGTVVAWGSDAFGQSSVPANLGDVVSISAGGWHTVALKSGKLPTGVALDINGRLHGMHEMAYSDDITLMVRDICQKSEKKVLNLTLVANPNTRPIIESLVPSNTPLNIYIDETQSFLVVASDPEGQTLHYSWTFNGDSVGEDIETLTLGNGEWLLGENTVEVSISDDFWIDQLVQQWTVNTVHHPLVITTPAALPEGMEMVIYDEQLEAEGGIEPYVWSTPGTVRGWGNNNYSQISIPADLSDAISLATSSTHSLALKADGSVVAWGKNNDGESTVPGDLGDVVSIAAGFGYSLALKSDGTVVSWGKNDYGQGVIPGDLRDVVSISAGSYHCLALKSDGTVVAWGRENKGQSTVPTDLFDVVSISAGTYHNLALKSDGTVVAWGANTYGESTVPTDLEEVMSISAGGTHSLALKSDGSVTIWGDNSYGQSIVPNDLVDVVSIAAGVRHNLALKSDGTVVAWGNNNNGQILVPDDLKNVTFISAGGNHSLALVSGALPSGLALDLNGRLQGTHEQTFSGDLTFLVRDLRQVLVEKVVNLTLVANPNTRPVIDSMIPSETYLNLYLNDAQLFGVTASDPEGQALMYSWKLNGVSVGENYHNLTLGDGEWLLGENKVRVSISDGFWTDQVFQEWTVNAVPRTLVINTPASLPEGMEMVAYDVQLEAEGGVESYIWSTPGIVLAWGSDDQGQSTVPVDLKDVVSVAAGRYHSLALKFDGTVEAWGADTYGQSTVPADLVDVVSIAAGEYHSLALKSDGTVVAWGNDFYGQSTLPPDLVDVVSIAAEEYHNLALKSDGTVVAWGADQYGQNTVPADLTDVVSIAAGSNFSLALQRNGTVVAWGKNTSGQCDVPEDLTAVVSVMAGDAHSLALKSDGTVVAWGANSSGQIAVPEDLTDVVSIAAGRYHSLALKSDGTVQAWGAGWSDQTTVPEGLEVTSIAAGGDFNLAIVSAQLPKGLLLEPNGRLHGTPEEVFNRSLYLIVRDIRQISIHKDIHLTILANPNTRPVIENRVPFSAEVNLYNDEGQSFGVTASDSEGQSLQYSWKLNGNEVGGDFDTLTIGDDEWMDGENIVKVTVSDGLWTEQVFHEWTVNISTRPLGITTPASLPEGMEMVSYDVQLEAARGTEPYRWLIPGTVVAWGSNNSGQSTVPSGLDGVVSIGVGRSHSLALKADGTVVAWGNNEDGQISVPLDLENVVSIAAGGYHNLALKSDGTVVAWGNNEYGQSSVPEDLEDVVSITATDAYSLALKSDGAVVIWGNLLYLGFGGLLNSLNDIISFSAGPRHSTFLKSDGTVVSTGSITRAPGDLENVVSVSSGYLHSLALKSDGTVVAWGLDTVGQSTVPSDLEDVVSISAGYFYSLVLKSDGTLVSMGLTNTIPNDLGNVVSVAAGTSHSLALISGELPPGLSLDLNGRLHGVPEEAFNGDLHLMVMDSRQGIAQKDLQLTIIENPNSRPVITETSIPAGVTLLPENQQVTFSVNAMDPENQPLTYIWKLNGEVVGGNQNNYDFSTIWGEAGNYQLQVELQDDLWNVGTVTTNWDITVISDNDEDGVENLIEIDLGRNPDDSSDGGIFSMISGRITGEGVLIEGARIELRGQSGTVYHDVFSSADGTYSIGNVIPGSYFRKVSAEGFKDEWFDGATHRDEAQVYEVNGDSLLDAVDLDLASGQSPAKVKIQSNPSGAAVYLNNHLTGEVTPVTLDLGQIEGEDLIPHVITLRKNGLPRSERKIVQAVEAETVDLSFDLENPGAGSIEIQTTPPGATVYVDGVNVSDGVTPVTVDNLAPGPHMVIVQKSGYLQARPVIAQVGDEQLTPVSIPISLETEPALEVLITSIPGSMSILVDYLPSGLQTDSTISYLDPASYSGTGWESTSHTVMFSTGNWIGPSLLVDAETTSLHQNISYDNPELALDQNTNGLPDQWEAAYDFINLAPLNKQAAEDDADGDGVSNIDELVSGTHPLNAASLVKVMSFSVGNDGDKDKAILTFQTVPDRRYVVQVCSGLITGDWINVSGIIQANSTTTSFEVSIPPGTNPEFYRLLILR